MSKKKISINLPKNKSMDKKIDDWVSLGALDKTEKTIKKHTPKIGITKLTIHVPKDIQRLFKIKCMNEDITMSEKITEFMRSFVQ